MHEAGAAVIMRTYWAWETTSTLRLLGGMRGPWAYMGEEMGGGISCRHVHSLLKLYDYCNLSQYKHNSNTVIRLIVILLYPNCKIVYPVSQKTDSELLPQTSSNFEQFSIFFSPADSRLKTPALLVSDIVNNAMFCADAASNNSYHALKFGRLTRLVAELFRRFCSQLDWGKGSWVDSYLEGLRGDHPLDYCTFGVEAANNA